MHSTVRKDFILNETEVGVLQGVLNEHLEVLGTMPGPHSDRQNLEARVIVNLLKKMERA